MPNQNMFDLVVFEEFSYNQFGLPPQVLHAIRKKVENGGAFMMIGGKKTLGRRSPYALKGIKEMIQTVLKLSYVNLSAPLTFTEFDEAGELFSDDEFIVYNVRLSHDVP